MVFTNCLITNFNGHPSHIVQSFTEFLSRSLNLTLPQLDSRADIAQRTEDVVRLVFTVTVELADHILQQVEVLQRSNRFDSRDYPVGLVL